MVSVKLRHYGNCGWKFLVKQDGKEEYYRTNREGKELWRWNGEHWEKIRNSLSFSLSADKETARKRILAEWFKKESE